MSPIRNLLFDLDGTLVDSRETIGASISHALEVMGLSADVGGKIDSVIGISLLDIFRDVFGMKHDQAEIAIEHYRVHYDRLGQAGTHVYPDIFEILLELKQAGFRLFVATVKPTPIAEKVLLDLELRWYFDGVAGSSMGHERRDKGSIIAHALEQFELEPAHSMMIGDREQDISGARENGLRCLAVTYGFGSMDELEAAGPDHMAASSGEIAAVIRNGIANAMVTPAPTQV
jgi:phosphoglycolate phosphatase